MQRNSIGDTPLLVPVRKTDSIDPKIFSRAGRYVGVIGASYALMQFLFAPVLGALSDRFGRRPIILISLFGLGIDFLIQGFAPNIWWLFVGRLLAGVMGASFTTANAYIADVSTDETRARNFGFVGMMFGLGFTIGPALGGLLGRDPSYDCRSSSPPAWHSSTGSMDTLCCQSRSQLKSGVR